MTESGRVLPLSQWAVLPLVPPDVVVDDCHADQVEELVAGGEAVGSSQEVCIQGVVVQLREER